MLTYIDINKINPHPDNPRKDLGDLAELAASIKTQGILQNLTVVPDHNWYNSDTKEFERYTAVIGHRRHAAAKIAGLMKVPCIISDMSKKEQVATMLLENMQRNDLTIYEQARGFQQLIDFGESIDDIAAATGFSRTTVKHRVKLLELDGERFKKAVERGGTIQDYIDLEKIQNVKTRNKVLEEIGTSNFKWHLDQAIEEEARPERKMALVAELNKFAKPIKDKEANKLSYVNGFYGFKMDRFKKPSDAQTVEYFYTVDSNSITLYKKEPKAQQKKLTENEKDFNKRKAQLKELSEQAYESRFTFIENFTSAKKYQEVVVTALVRSFFNYNSSGTEQVMKLLGIEKPKDWGDRYISPGEYGALISSRYVEQPDRVLLILTYAKLSDGKDANYYSSEIWRGNLKYGKNVNLDAIYDFLMDLGYELSDEEQALRDGTHELYDKEAGA